MRPSDDGIARTDGDSAKPPSPRVQLEVAFLDADDVASPPTPSARDERPRLTALVVAAEADVRLYVRECLRERTDMQLLESNTAMAAATLAAQRVPDLLIVEERQMNLIAAGLPVRTIVIADDVPRDPHAGPASVRWLARPFTAERLLAEIHQLID